MVFTFMSVVSGSLLIEIDDWLRAGRGGGVN